MTHKKNDRHIWLVDFDNCYKNNTCDTNTQNAELQNNDVTHTTSGHKNAELQHKLSTLH